MKKSDPISPAENRPKPFLKWVGGKRQLLAELLDRLPEKFNHYHEPFLGGGALFFELSAQGRIPSKATLSDLNEELINAYAVVRDQASALIRSLKKRPHDEAYYYALRGKKPKGDVERASRLIYLNKTCYNGLYRVNSKGEFNVPFGRYKHPLICDEGNLKRCAAALKNAELLRQPFEAVRKAARPKDLVYFDPPYVPVSNTANFAAYEKSGFGFEDHEQLRNLFVEMDRRGCYVMLSNSHAAFTEKLYRNLPLKNGYADFRVVQANRAVNSKSSGRGPVGEILVRNF